MIRQLIALVLILFVANGSSILNIAGTYRVAESKCSKSLFSGCPYTQTFDNSDWMCPVQDNNTPFQFTCDRDNLFFVFRDDGYIYNSDIKMKIVFDAQKGYWVSTDSDIQEIIYECGTGVNQDLESQCGPASKNQRILATQNVSQPCAVILEQTNQVNLYSEKLDVFGKIYTCKCGKISHPQSKSQPICSSSLMEITCSKDTVETDFGQLICPCGRITLEADGKYKCETGKMEIKYRADFKKYVQKLSMINSEYDELGNEVESISINMDAQLTISSEVSEEMIKILLGFNMIEMQKVEVTKKSTKSSMWPFSSSPSPISPPKPNPQDQVQILYNIDVLRQDVDDISENDILKNLQRAVQQPSSAIEKDQETFDLFDSVAVKGIKQELANYQSKLKMSIHKEGKRFLQADSGDSQIIENVEVENGIVDIMVTETEDQSHIFLMKTYSESDFVKIQFDLGGEIPEIDHIEVSQFDQTTGIQVENQIKHTFQYSGLDTTQPHLKNSFFKKNKNNGDQEESDVDEILFTKGFSSTIEFQSNLSNYSFDQQSIEQHKQLFQQTEFVGLESQIVGSIKLDEDFEILEDVLDDEEKANQFQEMFAEVAETESEDQEFLQKSKKIVAINGKIAKQQNAAKLWRHQRIQQIKDFIRKLQEAARTITDVAKEIHERAKTPYKFENYYQIRNTRLFGQQCQLGVGLLQENEMTTAVLVLKLNDFIQFPIKEFTFNTCSDVDRTISEEEIEKTIFQIKYPIWGFVSTFVKFDMKFSMQAKLKSLFSQKSHTCQSKLNFFVTPSIRVEGGVRAFALANIGLYGSGSFFSGELALNVETWGPIKNTGEIYMSYTFLPFRYETGFFKNIITCKFTLKSLFTFHKLCNVGEIASTPLYFNDFNNLKIQDRVLNFLQNSWGKVPQPTQKVQQKE